MSSVLDDAHAVTVLLQELVNVLPTGAVDETTVNQNHSSSHISHDDFLSPISAHKERSRNAAQKCKGQRLAISLRTVVSASVCRECGSLRTGTRLAARLPRWPRHHTPRTRRAFAEGLRRNWACNLLPGVTVVRKKSIGGVSLAWRTRVLFGAACDRFSIGFRVIEELSRLRPGTQARGCLTRPLRDRCWASFPLGFSQTSHFSDTAATAAWSVTLAAGRTNFPGPTRVMTARAAGVPVVEAGRFRGATS